MNTRIRELAEQCYHRYSEYNINLEKFAYLLIKEVFAKIEDERFEVYQPVKESVMKHFEVQ